MRIRFGLQATPYFTTFQAEAKDRAKDNPNMDFLIK